MREQSAGVFTANVGCWGHPELSGRSVLGIWFIVLVPRVEKLGRINGRLRRVGMRARYRATEHRHHTAGHGPRHRHRPAQAPHIPCMVSTTARSLSPFHARGQRLRSSITLASRVQPVANGLVAPTPCSPGDLDRPVDEDRHIPFPKRQQPQGLELDLSKVGNRLSTVPRRREALEERPRLTREGIGQVDPPRQEPRPAHSPQRAPARHLSGSRACHISQKMFVVP